MGWNILQWHPGGTVIGRGLQRTVNFLGPDLWAAFPHPRQWSFLGNLGIIHLLNQGFQRVAAPGGVVEGANFFQRIWYGLKGFFLVLGGLNLPYGPGDWYWFSSRIFPPGYGDFYEFPVFTFI